VVVVVALVEPAHIQLATEMPRSFTQMARHQPRVVATVDLEKSRRYSHPQLQLHFQLVK
jgi:hypothetical protein